MEGKKRAPIAERKLYVGNAPAKVEAICPDNDGLRDLGYNIDDKKDEPNYVGDKEGVTTVRLDFYMRVVENDYLYKRTFFLEDRDVVTKVKDSMTDEEIDAFIPKYQFVNQTGDSFYCADEDTLPDYFTKFQKNTSKTDKTKIIFGEKKFRVAKAGEADLLDFLKKWLSELDFWDIDTNILPDMKKIFNGNFKELQDLVDSDLTERVEQGQVVPVLVVDLLGVKRDNKDGEEKLYQDVYKTTLPGYLWKAIKKVDFSEENIEKWRKEKYNKNTNPKGIYLKEYQQLAVDVTDKSYPWSREFVLGA
ncbi:MAG TPA: hypothetical protein VLE44_02335, partial [Candidatus Saccharimonadales bacterium]|nr:hypothetical protein [Candidatus Saccharimonadales bacterium]